MSIGINKYSNSDSFNFPGTREKPFVPPKTMTDGVRNGNGNGGGSGGYHKKIAVGFWGDGGNGDGPGGNGGGGGGGGWRSDGPGGPLGPNGPFGLSMIMASIFALKSGEER